MRTSIVIALFMCMPLYANEPSDISIECENNMMNELHSEVIYELSSDIVEINNEIIQDEIAKVDATEAPEEVLLESIDSVTELNNELTEQEEVVAQNHPKKSFFERAKSRLTSTSNTLIAFSKKAFQVTKEKSIIAGTFIARESKKAFGFLKNQINFLISKWDDKQEEKKKNKEELIAQYSKFELFENKFTASDKTYTSKIYRGESLRELMTTSNKNEKILVYALVDDKIYNVALDGSKSRVSLLTLKTHTIKDLSQISIESNFIKNEEIKKVILTQKRALESSLDKVNRNLQADPTSAEHLICAHRIAQAIIDLKEKMRTLKQQDMTPNKGIASHTQEKPKYDVTKSESVTTKDGEIIDVYEVDI